MVKYIQNWDKKRSKQTYTEMRNFCLTVQGKENTQINDFWSSAMPLSSEEWGRDPFTRIAICWERKHYKVTEDFWWLFGFLHFTPEHEISWNNCVWFRFLAKQKTENRREKNSQFYWVFLKNLGWHQWFRALYVLLFPKHDWDIV